MDLIKYQNRRLYSSTLRRHVTLEEVGDAFDRGQTITVRMRRDGRDVSLLVVLAMLIERAENGRLSITQAQLRQLIMEKNHD